MAEFALFRIEFAIWFAFFLTIDFITVYRTPVLV